MNLLKFGIKLLIRTEYFYVQNQTIFGKWETKDPAGPAQRYILT